MPRLFFLLALFATVLTAPQSSQAFWWLFDDDDEWKTMPVEEQTRLASEYYEKAQEAEANGNNGRARDNYKEVWKKYPGATMAPEALYRALTLQMEDHDWNDAYKACTRLLQFYPETPHFSAIVESLFSIATAYEEGIDTHFLWIIPARREGKAIEVYESLISYAPYSDYAPLALMRIALIYRERDEITEAIDALDRLINNYPRSMLSSDAYLSLADTYGEIVSGPEYDQGSTREAISYFQDFLILFPQNPAVANAEEGLDEMLEVYAQSRLIMGEFYYLRRDNYTAAEVFFNDAITIAPESESAEEAREYLEVIAAIDRAYPDGNYPRRNVWQHLMFWTNFDPAEDIPGVTLDPNQQPREAPKPETEPTDEIEEVGGLGPGAKPGEETAE